ncbi:hypothetical protein ACHAXA_003807 [Cyclostephanos tholiformis]|uniref:Uncharacterized protein n=1 Tax=Cyclostephanos tholiformis TaxID=382380 RepID=A0ABD3RWH2_9STRA
MKFVLASLFAAVASAVDVIPQSSISASSPLGQRLLSEARLLENNQNQVDYTWVANMDLKYQGCYHTQVWNGDANENEDVKVSTQRLVRFRLCQSGTCSATNAAGCDGSYGDYVIGMETYLASYMEIIQKDHEYNCKYEEQYGEVAACENADNKDYCKYDTYMAKGMEYCIDRNPYEEDNGNKNGQNQNEMMNKIAQGCQQFKVQNRRQLEDQVKYYMGAYCSDSGGAIHLGLFSDDTCTTFVDESKGADTYLSLTGYALPYSDTTMIGTECVSCKEPKDVNQNGQNDQYDADEVKEACENLYAGSGKCESQLTALVDAGTATTSACNFIAGVKIYRKNGSIIKAQASAGTTASVFIGLFATSFVLLGGYAYYLKTKLDRAKVNIDE